MEEWGGIAIVNVAEYGGIDGWKGGRIGWNLSSESGRQTAEFLTDDDEAKRTTSAASGRRARHPEHGGNAGDTMFTPVHSAKKRLRPETPAASAGPSATATPLVATTTPARPAVAGPAGEFTGHGTARRAPPTTPFAGGSSVRRADAAAPPTPSGYAVPTPSARPNQVLERGDHHSVTAVASWPDKLRAELGADGTPAQAAACAGSAARAHAEWLGDVRAARTGRASVGARAAGRWDRRRVARPRQHLLPVVLHTGTPPRAGRSAA